VHFPYASAADTIRFLDSAGVDYIVLRRGSTFTDYYDDWLNHGIPDPRAQLVYTSSGASPFIVFRWRKSDDRNEELPNPRIESTMLLPESTMDRFMLTHGIPGIESEASHSSELRRAIGYARSYVEQLDLAALVPHGELASTGHCLADPVHGLYLVYAPDRVKRSR
jgi:hypothetical protein